MRPVTQRCLRRVTALSQKRARCRGRVSPEDDRERQCERGDHEAEVDPGPVSIGVLGKHEKMDHDPQTHPKSQRKPDEIAGGLVNGRKGLALGAAHAHGHDHERPDKQRTQGHTQYPQSQRDGRCRRSNVGWTELLRLGAHKVAVADPSVSGARLYVCKVRRAARNAGHKRGQVPGMARGSGTPRRGVHKEQFDQKGAFSRCPAAPRFSLRPRSTADIRQRRDVGAVSNPRPGRSVWTPLIAASDRRGLVDDFAHRRGALFGSFQVFKDYRQRGRPAVLLDREPGAGNEARPDVDVLYLPHSPNHSIAPSSRPDSRLGWLRRSSSAVRDLERLASRPWIEAEVMGVVSNVAALTEPGTMRVAGRWVDHRNLKLASITVFGQMR